MRCLVFGLLVAGCGAASSPESQAFTAKAREWAALQPASLPPTPHPTHPSGTKRLPAYVRPKLAIIDTVTGELDETHFGLDESIRAKTPEETTSVVRITWEKQLYSKAVGETANFYRLSGRFDVVDLKRNLKTWPHPESRGLDAFMGELPPMVGRGKEIVGKKPTEKVAKRLREHVDETAWLWSSLK